MSFRIPIPAAPLGLATVAGLTAPLVLVALAAETPTVFLFEASALIAVSFRISVHLGLLFVLSKSDQFERAHLRQFLRRRAVGHQLLFARPESLTKSSQIQARLSRLGENTFLRFLFFIHVVLDVFRQHAELGIVEFI